MSFINDKSKEIHCKIIYFGPPRSGKSTSLKLIAAHARKDSKGELISLNRGDDRTLYFDFVPLELGKVKGYTIRLHLYTVPGEIGYHAARELTSKGLDGVVFIADSDLTQMEANLASLESLRQVLAKEGDDLENIPMVFQYNKRDLPLAVPTSELSRILNFKKVPEFETIATKGKGVFEAFQTIAEQVLTTLSGKQ
ncbi:MAG: GTPase domain-containing protein [Deltaproteobacteria bacterium]|nr:GTPase domain-containing protein [Deltaproteobacteria bacterium]